MQATQPHLLSAAQPLQLRLQMACSRPLTSPSPQRSPEDVTSHAIEILQEIMEALQSGAEAEGFAALEWFRSLATPITGRAMPRLRSPGKKSSLLQKSRSSSSLAEFFKRCQKAKSW